MTTPLQQHFQKWENCRECSLCETRNKVVLMRGRVPADVVMCGIAPGKSENCEGVPFWGPAGKMLDRIIVEVLDVYKLNVRIAFTNLVCCIPLDESGKWETDPESTEILKCKPRLLEFIGMCQPKVLIAVGDLPYKWLKKWNLPPKLATITHPSAILRRPMAMQEAAYRKNVIVLRDAFMEITDGN